MHFSCVSDRVLSVWHPLIHLILTRALLGCDMIIPNLMSNQRAWCWERSKAGGEGTTEDGMVVKTTKPCVVWFWEGNGDVLHRAPSRKGDPHCWVLSASLLWQSAPAETASVMDAHLTLEFACLEVAQIWQQIGRGYKGLLFWPMQNHRDWPF